MLLVARDEGRHSGSLRPGRQLDRLVKSTNSGRRVAMSGVMRRTIREDRRMRGRSRLIVGLAAAGAIVGIGLVRSRVRRTAPRAARSHRGRRPQRPAGGGRCARGARPMQCTGPAVRSRRPTRAPPSTMRTSCAPRPRWWRRSGDMKGALMKIGQMASYLDDGMPEPDAGCARVAPAGRAADGAGTRRARRAPGARRRAGDRVFAAWDPVPVAAASIGQVHRGAHARRARRSR